MSTIEYLLLLFCVVVLVTTGWLLFTSSVDRNIDSAAFSIATMEGRQVNSPIIRSGNAYVTSLPKDSEQSNLGSPESAGSSFIERVTQAPPISSRLSNHQTPTLMVDNSGQRVSTAGRNVIAATPPITAEDSAFLFEVIRSPNTFPAQEIVPETNTERTSESEEEIARRQEILAATNPGEGPNIKIRIDRNLLEHGVPTPKSEHGHHLADVAAYLYSNPASEYKTRKYRTTLGGMFAIVSGRTSETYPVIPDKPKKRGFVNGLSDTISQTTASVRTAIRCLYNDECIENTFNYAIGNAGPLTKNLVTSSIEQTVSAYQTLEHGTEGEFLYILGAILADITTDRIPLPNLLLSSKIDRPTSATTTRLGHEIEWAS